MPKNIPSLKPKQLIRLLEKAGCTFYREGKGDHSLYTRVVEGKTRVVPIDMGAGEVSPACVCGLLGSSDLQMRKLRAC